MRTVQDPQGISWICLELPEIPADRVAAAAGMQPAPVAVECNSGAARAIVLLPEGWADDLADDALVAEIERTVGAGG
jgi:hypothetical protein